MQSSRRRVIPGMILAAFLVACGGGGGDTSDAGNSVDVTLPDGGEHNPPIRDLTVVPNPSNAVSVYVEWSTGAPTPTELEVECGEEWTQTYRSPEERKNHRVFVAGLWEGASCKATARAAGGVGEPTEATKEFEAGPLDDFLPDLEVRERSADRMAEGWTLLNLWNNYDNVPLTAAVVDDQGRYRWYHQLSTSNSGSDTQVRVFREGVLIGGNRQYVGPHYVNWQGEIVWKDDFVMHHDIRPVAEGDEFLYLTHGEKCEADQASGNAIVRYDWQNKTKLKEWNFCEFFVPDNPEPNWSHLNTIEPFPDESAFLISSRTQHTIFKIDLENDELVWKMGIEGDFGLSGDDRFFRQHAPEIQPNGNIVMFDNGSFPHGEFSRPWSRAIEISYDPNARSAEIVWSYRPDPDLFAPIWGDADRLENGNTLVTFGLRNRDASRNSRIVEVERDGTEVWRLDAPNKWGWYRADRLADRPTGAVVEN